MCPSDPPVVKRWGEQRARPVKLKLEQIEALFPMKSHHLL